MVFRCLRVDSKIYGFRVVIIVDELGDTISEKPISCEYKSAANQSPWGSTQPPNASKWAR